MGDAASQSPESPEAIRRIVKNWAIPTGAAAGLSQK
jgi:hypothetical protein